MEDKFKEALEWYNKTSEIHGRQNPLRTNQLTKVVGEIGNYFDFSSITCIETGASKDPFNDGAVGMFFAKLCELTGGEFHSVDIDPNVTEGSQQFYNKLNLKVNHHTQDSVEFLQETNIVPNLVHLDSWDVNLKNPLPCALHGWREFVAIEDKMPVGSILIVDDNWFKGSWVDWVYPTKTERIDITYPILGKGALLWHFIGSGNSNWGQISEDIVGFNVKLVFQKLFD